MDSHLFRVMEEQNCSPCLADTFRRNDRPPTHFFVKKKFIHTSGAATATQRTSSLFCAGSPVRHRESPARRRELFSLRKKRTAGIRLSAWQREGSLYRLDPTPFPPLKSPLKLRVPRGFNPLGRSLGTASPRSCPSTTQSPPEAFSYQICQ